ASTTRSTSAQTPRVAKALTETFVSRKTLKRHRARHPRPSGIPAPQRTARLYVGAVRISAGSTVAGGHRARAHFWSVRSVCRAGQGAFPDRGPGEWSQQIACRTMYYERPLKATPSNLRLNPPAPRVTALANGGKRRAAQPRVSAGRWAAHI